MKFKFIYSLFIIFGAIILMSSSGGRASAANDGNTGAPGETGLTCSSCHNSGTFGTVTASLSVADALGNMVTSYIPGDTYDVTLNSTAQTGSPAGYGFQLTILDSTEGNAGVYGNPGMNVGIASLTSGRTYVEHNGTSATNSFTFQWTAPASGTGDVTVYFNSNAVDGTGTTVNDNSSMPSSMIITESLAPPCITSFPWIEDFETFVLCADDGLCNEDCKLAVANDWVQDTTDGDDWRINAGPTGSANTGPAMDFNPGSVTGKYIYTEANGCSNTQSIIETPCFDLSSLTTPSISFRLHKYGSDMGSTRLEITTDLGVTWDSVWAQTGQIQTAPNDPWMDVVIDVSSFVPNNQAKFRFVGTTGGSFNSDMALDNIIVGEMPTCLTPSGVMVSNVTTNSAEIAWTSNNTTPTSYIEYGPIGFMPGGGTITMGSSPVSLTGLSGNTDFSAYVYEICSVGDTANLISIDFRTLCVPVPGDSIADPIVAVLPFMDTVNTGFCYTNQYVGRDAPDIFFSFTTGACTDSITLSTCSDITTFDSYIYLLDSSGMVLAFNDDALPGACGFLLNGLNRFSVLTYDVAPNTSYYMVLDGFGSTSIGEATVEIAEIFLPAITVSVDTISDVSCNGAGDGAISISVTGASSYIWSNGETMEDISGLAPGSYSVTVSDMACSIPFGPYVVNEPDSLTGQISNTPEICVGTSTGEASIVVAGGSPPYVYTWSNGGTTSSIIVTAGNYTVTVVDGEGCMISNTTTVTSPPAIVTSFTITDESLLGASDGAVDLTVTNGIPPFTYLWSNGETSEDISGLSGGIYNVTITDSNGCTASDQAVVAPGPNGIDDLTFTNFELYPNPAQHTVRINAELANSESISIELIDVLGKTLNVENLGEVSTVNQMLDLSRLPDGVYFVRIAAEGAMLTKRLIVKR